MFDILDHEDELEQDRNEKQMWEKIREEFNFNYQFDNTYDNIQEQDDEEFFQYITGAENERDKVGREIILFEFLSKQKVFFVGIRRRDSFRTIINYESFSNDCE